MCTILDYDNWRTEWAFQIVQPWKTIYLYFAKVNYYKQKVWQQKSVLYYNDNPQIPNFKFPWLEEKSSIWHGTNGYAPIDFIKASIYDYTV